MAELNGPDQAVVRLHTWARRYCMERDEYWSRRYAEGRKGRETEVPYRYSDEDYDRFPRYNVLRAILRAVERLDPALINSEREMRSALLAAITTGESAFTSSTNPIETSAMSSERAVMEAALASVSEADLRRIAPLPYRRILQDDESLDIRSRLKERWGIDPSGYWYPLTGDKRADAEAFQAPWLLHNVPPRDLQRILEKREISRIWEVREGGPDYIIDRAFFNPVYNGDEGYWTSDPVDWIAYASHESSLTVGGWLLAEVKAAWPPWADHLYRGWEFESPPRSHSE